MSQTAPGVLVTRPAHQSAALIQQIQNLGLVAIPCPANAINAIQPEMPALRRENYPIIIFISTNAVENGIKYIEHATNFAEKQIFAIGKSTAQSLFDRGLSQVTQPSNGFNSEALLTLDAFSPEHIKQQNILIIRGQGGREHLAEALRHRGARVDYLEVYQRIQADPDIDPIINRWSAGQINIVTVSSNESLKNLYHILQGRGLTLLLNTPLITPGERCSELARQLGFSDQILQATSATDDDIMMQLKIWLDSKN